MISSIQPLGEVPFPSFQSERFYMVPFRPSQGLPTVLDRWRRTVYSMLDGIEVPGEVYLMVDQAVVKGGQTHRRGGPHVDGNWIANMNGHGNGGHTGRPGHGARASRWGNGGGGGGGWTRPTTDGVWRSEDFTPELLVLASDVSACVAYLGEVEGDPKAGGDCSHLDLSGLEKVRLEPGKAYAGNVTMIHESVQVPADCRRSLVRLNIPGGVVRSVA